MATAYVAGDFSTSDNVNAVTGLSWPAHGSNQIALLIWALFATYTPTMDSDFTELDNDVDQNLRAILGQRLPASMTGSESGTVSLTTGADLNRMAAALAIWSGVDSIGSVVNYTEGGTAVSEHPATGSMSITPLQDNSRIALIYAERSSTGNIAGDMVAPSLGGTPATIRQERGTGNTGGTYVCIADIQLGAGTAGVAQVFTQWNAADANIASNAEMWLVELRELSTGTTVSPGGIVSGEAWGSPSVAGSLTAGLSGIATGEAWGTPAIAAVLATTAAGISSGEAWGTPAVSMLLAAALTGIPSGQAWGTPAVTASLTVSPTGIASAVQFGTPSVSGSLGTTLTGVASGEAWGAPAVSAQLTVSPTGIPTGEQFGTPDVTSSSGSSPVGIGSAEAWGTPAVSAVLAATVAGITSGETWGSPAAQLSLLVGAIGIDSAELWGSPAVTGATPVPRRDITLRGGIEPARLQGMMEPGLLGGIEPGRLIGAMEWL